MWWLRYSIHITTWLPESAWLPVWELRARRQCLMKVCVASKQLWCLLCVLWRACCPGSIQGFHTSLTHFSLPGFLLAGHKLGGGREGERVWDQRGGGEIGGRGKKKKDQSGPHFDFGGLSGKRSKSFISNGEEPTCCSEARWCKGKGCGFCELRQNQFGFIHSGAAALLTLYVLLMTVSTWWLMRLQYSPLKRGDAAAARVCWRLPKFAYGDKANHLSCKNKELKRMRSAAIIFFLQ